MHGEMVGETPNFTEGGRGENPRSERKIAKNPTGRDTKIAPGEIWAPAAPDKITPKSTSFSFFAGPGGARFETPRSSTGSSRGSPAGAWGGALAPFSGPLVKVDESMGPGFFFRFL